MLNPKVRNINLKAGGRVQGEALAGVQGVKPPPGGSGGGAPERKRTRVREVKLKSGYELCDLRKLMNEHFFYF